jgi:hypothetical protein
MSIRQVMQEAEDAGSPQAEAASGRRNVGLQDRAFGGQEPEASQR